MNSYIYQKSEAGRYNLSRILGNGVLVVEEDKHKQQVSPSYICSPEKLWTTLIHPFPEEGHGKVSPYLVQDRYGLTRTRRTLHSELLK